MNFTSYYPRISSCLSHLGKPYGGHIPRALCYMESNEKDQRVQNERSHTQNMEYAAVGPDNTLAFSKPPLHQCWPHPFLCRGHDHVYMYSPCPPNAATTTHNTWQMSSINTHDPQDPDGHTNPSSMFLDQQLQPEGCIASSKGEGETTKGGWVLQQNRTAQHNNDSLHYTDPMSMRKQVLTSHINTSAFSIVRKTLFKVTWMADTWAWKVGGKCSKICLLCYPQVNSIFVIMTSVWNVNIFPTENRPIMPTISCQICVFNWHRGTE